MLTVLKRTYCECNENQMAIRICLQLNTFNNLIILNAFFSAAVAAVRSKSSCFNCYDQFGLEIEKNNISH